MNYAVVTAVGKDRPGLVNELTAVVFDLGLSVEDSRMSSLRGEFAMLLAIAGAPDALAGLERALDEFANAHDVAYVLRTATPQSDSATTGLPYTVTVAAMDHPGIVKDVGGFFSARNINIYDLATQTSRAPHTGTPMFNLSMKVSVPQDAHLASLREAFDGFCSDRNLDGELRPES